MYFFKSAHLNIPGTGGINSARGLSRIIVRKPFLLLSLTLGPCTLAVGEIPPSTDH